MLAKARAKTKHGGLTEWLRSSPGKRVRLRRPRGFESHVLRHKTPSFASWQERGFLLRNFPCVLKKLSFIMKVYLRQKLEITLSHS